MFEEAEIKKTQIYEWLKRFHPRCEQLPTSTNDKNNECDRDEEISAEVEMSAGIVHCVLHKDSNMHCV
jgi:hypothetical protein